jgi:hypothetical protein
LFKVTQEERADLLLTSAAGRLRDLLAKSPICCLISR